VIHAFFVVMGVGLACFVLAFLLDLFDGSDLTPPPAPPKPDPREEGIWYAYLQDKENFSDFGSYLKAKREAFRREDQEA
jgi:hypothetical protein